jgi:hypothetical protein
VEEELQAGQGNSGEECRPRGGQSGALRLGLAPAGGRGVLWANTGARGGAELASHHAGPSEPMQMNSGEAKLAKIRCE